MALIELQDVDLEYYVYGASSRSFKMNMVRAATGGLLKNEQKVLKVEALKQINFKLQPGDRLGLVGHNGAGKSSLLKLLAKIYDPSSGNVLISGETNCLFDIMV